MRSFFYDMKGPEVHLFPLVCWHLGAKQSATKFIEEVIRQIKADPLARWIYLGDAGECVTKTSKGNIYEQLYNPGDQLRVAVEYLTPIREKGLFGIRGNHGNRVDKESGVGWDELLCARVGIPYLGVSGFGAIRLQKPRTNCQTLATVYCHHGSAGSITPGGKLAGTKKAESFIDADVLLTAHHHGCGPGWPLKQVAYYDIRTKSVKWRTQRSYACGSAYDSRSGYAEEKMYAPILPEHIVVNLKLHRIYKPKTHVLEVTHRTIEGFDGKYISDEERLKWEGR